mmetsp:Transcript_11744/g.37386  ORF Transcript_11744/g.37386 Transcript_11744/m.37386 type:complete len:209 (-) Transcript_11744:238-864(-)
MYAPYLSVYDGTSPESRRKEERKRSCAVRASLLHDTAQSSAESADEEAPASPGPASTIVSSLSILTGQRRAHGPPESFARTTMRMDISWPRVLTVTRSLSACCVMPRCATGFSRTVHDALLVCLPDPWTSFRGTSVSALVSRPTSPRAVPPSAPAVMLALACRVRRTLSLEASSAPLTGCKSTIDTSLGATNSSTSEAHFTRRSGTWT